MLPLFDDYASVIHSDVIRRIGKLAGYFLVEGIKVKSNMSRWLITNINTNSNRLEK